MADFLSKLASGAGQRDLKAKSGSLAKNQSKADVNPVKNTGSAAGAEMPPRTIEVMSAEAAGRLLKQIGLFDQAYYSSTYPDVAAVGADPFEHFFFHGYKEGRRPIRFSIRYGTPRRIRMWRIPICSRCCIMPGSVKSKAVALAHISSRLGIANDTASRRTRARLRII